jgi:hypothetical protein
MSTLYRKLGRRYEAVHDSEAYNGLSNGSWLVQVENGCTSIRKAVDPNIAAIQFATMMMSNKICKYLSDVSSARPRTMPYTKKQKEIFKLMQELPDKDKLLYWEYESLQGMADNILKLILEDYDKSTK